MSIFDEARALKNLAYVRNIKIGELARSLGMSASAVSNKIRLLTLTESEQSKITAEGLSERHARALLRIRDESERKRLLDEVCLRRLCVEETEALVDIYYSKSAPKRIARTERISATDSFLDSLEESKNALTRLGITAQKRIEYHGKKIYVSIVIDAEN